MNAEGTLHPLRVVIAGGGVGAAEAMLALRALAGAKVQITLLSPDAELRYRPLAINESFAAADVRRYALDAICRDLDVELCADTLASVDPHTHTIATGSGEQLAYDALVVGVGARAQASLARAHPFFADHTRDRLDGLVRDVQDRLVRRVAFVVPPGNGWALPAYELALLLSSRVRVLGVDDAELTIVTPEDVPLAIFRGAGSTAVAQLLEQAGIAVVCESYAHDYDGQTLQLAPRERAIAADRVVALPTLAGPAIAGVPSDADGFVQVDEHGRVPGLDDVYAVGDATAFPIKQGGLATQQADAVAAVIARQAGAGVAEPRTRPQLRAILLTGGAPLYLCGAVAGGDGDSRASKHCPWWPPHKIAARHLAPYLADRDVAGPQTVSAHAHV